MKKFLKTIEKKQFSINIFYLLNALFFVHLGFIGAIYIVFFYNFGISKLHTNMLSSIFAITVFLFEIPSGAYSDLFGTRKSLLLSGGLLVLSMTLFAFGNNLWVFALAQGFWGISFAFESGALDAWMVNNSQSKGTQLDNTFARARKINNLLSILSGFIGGLLSNFSLRWPWLLSVITSISYLALVYIFVNKEEKYVTNSESAISFKQGLESIKLITKNSIEYCLINPVVKTIIIFNLIISFSFSPIFVYWSPYLNGLFNKGIWILGWIWVMIKFSNFIGNAILEHLLKTNKDRYKIMRTSVACISIVVVTASLYKNFIVVLIMFILFEIFIEILQPLQSALINDWIPDGERATILSFNSMACRASNFLSLMVMGYLGDKVSMSFTWSLSGIIIMSNFAVIAYLKAKEIRHANIKKQN